MFYQPRQVIGEYTSMWEEDPTKVRRHGAKEEEVETVLGYVKVLKELESGILKAGTAQPRRDNQTEDAEDGGDAAEASKKPDWWKKKKDRKKKDGEE